MTATAFLHSNDTRSLPPAPERLERVAGVGRSPVVDYDGTGAYFLDRLAPGQWRLEVYPDAVWVNDPFGRDSLTREVSRVIWRERSMCVHLPDLGSALLGIRASWRALACSLRPAHSRSRPACTSCAALA